MCTTLATQSVGVNSTVTTLISWFGRDARGAASLYIAADSRVTWKQGHHGVTWDRARKVFASQRYPDIFGYCGNAFFPSQILGQAVDLIDRDLLLSPMDAAGVRIQSLRAFLDTCLVTYTDRASLKFELLYGYRNGDGPLCL